MTKTIASLIGAVLLACAAYGMTLHVPSQYPTIQSGINAAVNGDTVLVSDGIYTGAGNKNIDFLGKAIVVISENGAETCVVDCQNDGRGFYFHTGETSNSILSGFGIINGHAENGGGIFCSYSSPTIVCCQISGNIVDHYGGGIYLDFSDPLIEYCTISGDSADWDGGGIFCYESRMALQSCEIFGNRSFYAGGIWCEYSDPVIEYCNFRQNITTGDGGGILVGFYSHAIIYRCVFEGNSAWRGGGIWCHKSDLLLEDCIIEQNLADCGGGIICYWQSETTISNCTISGNSAETDGGGIHCSYSNTTILNTIVNDNTGNGGIYFGDYTNAEIRHGDFHHNENGNFTGTSITPGLGVIVTVNANGDSCDLFYNIFEDPLFENPGAGNFRLTWENFPSWDSTRSPCIDAGDPDSPADPDCTVADIGAFYYDQGPVIVILTPDSLPIFIPANGGSFSYNIECVNMTSSSIIVDIWCNVGLPNGQIHGPVMGPFAVNLHGNAAINRNRTQFIPGRVPAGVYSHNAYIGNYPDSIWHQDIFPFTKLTTGAEGPVVLDWSNTGDPLDSAIPVIPTEFALRNAYPNPFNASTQLSFDLPVACRVALQVFNIRGQLVATVVDGYRAAGSHVAVFDGTDLSSGLYFFRLIAGDFTATSKMVLLK